MFLEQFIAMERKYSNPDPMIEFCFQNRKVRINQTIYYKDIDILLYCLKNKNDYENDHYWDIIFEEENVFGIAFKITWSKDKDSVVLKVRSSACENECSYKAEISFMFTSKDLYESFLPEFELFVKGETSEFHWVIVEEKFNY